MKEKSKVKKEATKQSDWKAYGLCLVVAILFVYAISQITNISEYVPFSLTYFYSKGVISGATAVFTPAIMLWVLIFFTLGIMALVYVITHYAQGYHLWLTLLLAIFPIAAYYNSFFNAQMLLNSIFNEQIGSFPVFTTLENLMAFSAALGHFFTIFGFVLTCFPIWFHLVLKQPGSWHSLLIIILAWILFVFGQVLSNEQDAKLVKADFKQGIQSMVFYNMMSHCPSDTHSYDYYLILDDGYTLITHVIQYDLVNHHNIYKFNLYPGDYLKACLATDSAISWQKWKQDDILWQRQMKQEDAKFKEKLKQLNAMPQ